MPDVTIREVEGDELVEVAYFLRGYAFRSSPPLRDREEVARIMARRKGVTSLAAFVDGQALSTIASAPLVQQLRGSLFPMGGIFGVASHPQARRRGYVRQLMRAQLQRYHEEGRPLSCLYPFRESFYQRLGYVTFPHPRTAVFEMAELAPLLKRELSGELELKLIGEGYDEYRAFLRRLQHELHGMAIFEEEQKETVADNKQWIVLAREDAQVVGVMLYQMKGDFIPLTMEVPRFYYTTAGGRYLLLSWLARHIDQATTAEVGLPAFEMVRTWWPDLKLSIKLPFLAPQGRVIDVAGLGGMATGPGAFSVRLHDPFCPWNEGVWRLETVDGRLQVSRGGAAQGELTIQGLSALVYGTNDPAEFTFRGWGEVDPPLQEAMRTLFPRKMPHLHEVY